MILREVMGEGAREEGGNDERLIEVTDRGEKSKMTEDQVDRLKERQDIRVAEQGDSATVLHRLRG